MAEAKKPAPAADNDGGAKPKKNILMMVVIVLLVLLIAVLGVGAFVAYKVLMPPSFDEPVAEQAADGHGDEAASKDKKKKKDKKKEGDHAAAPVFTKLDTFTVNLANGSILQTEIHVQVSDEKQTDLIKNYLPRLSSQVNLLLSSKKLEDLTTYEGKVKLMDEVKQTLNKVLDAKDEEDGVMSVEFKTFIVQ